MIFLFGLEALSRIVFSAQSSAFLSSPGQLAAIGSENDKTNF